MKKYIFSITNINIEQLITLYNIQNESNTSTLLDEDFTNTTKLTELNNIKGTPDVISFLDESKRLHVCSISMIDFESRMNINLLRYHCYWCRHPFDTMPIGCPIHFVSSQAEKRYHSQITRDIYTIKESITQKKQDEINDEDFNVKIADYYETDGVFCSFNCCKAYIQDNKHNNRYDNSMMLLTKMYNELMGTKYVKITAAPHWRLIEQYGGHLNIIKFRESFNKIDYKFHGNTKKTPNFLSIGYLYEENIKF